ncbi:MAG: CzcE family metal-binding protein [Massilia sp.]
MKRFHATFAPFALATVLAASSVAAHAVTMSDEYGSAATGGVSNRTIVVDGSTRYINVMHGETVTIRNGDASVTWYFDGIAGAFSLSKILPAASPAVEIYVAPELIG